MDLRRKNHLKFKGLSNNLSYSITSTLLKLYSTSFLGFIEAIQISNNNLLENVCCVRMNQVMSLKIPMPRFVMNKFLLWLKEALTHLAILLIMRI